MRHLLTLGAAACLSTLPGCCTLARLFCGPDKSAWVPIDYATPENALGVLLEAIRRDNPEYVYDALSEGYRKRLGIDQNLVQLAWQRVKDATPGIHLAGYAAIPAPTRPTDDTAVFDLDVEGRPVRVALVREAFFELRYRRPRATAPGTFRRPVPDWSTIADVAPVPDQDLDLSRIVPAPVVFEHEGLDAVPVQAVDHVAWVRRWKVDDLQALQP
ncbi:MAG: hypothetical protein FJ265_13455 [Planctomycetes bacterium]|nr:hypothetical protein [Planctomycetota bacterium]